MTFSQRTPVVLALLTLFASACITPLAHPLRASDGPIAVVAISAGWTAPDAVSCYEGCFPSGVSGTGPSAQLTAGYAHVFAQHIGLMGGITAPVTDAVQGGRALPVSGFLFGTVQNEHGSVGFGPEIYTTGWALAMGAEWRLSADRVMNPALALYARWFVPTGGNDVNAKPPAQRGLELGARVRMGPLFLQYSYFAAIGGAFYVPIYIEGAYVTSALHVVSLGFALDGDFIASVRHRREMRRAARQAESTRAPEENAR